jgi:hypothetical protein
LTDGIDWVSTFNRTAPSGNRTSIISNPPEVEESAERVINFPSMIFSSQPPSSRGKRAVNPPEADIAKKEKTIESAQTFIDMLFVKTHSSVHLMRNTFFYSLSYLSMTCEEMQGKILSK